MRLLWGNFFGSELLDDLSSIFTLVEDVIEDEDVTNENMFRDCENYIRYLTQNNKLANKQEKQNILLIALTLENKYNNKTLTNDSIDCLIRSGKIWFNIMYK